MTMRPAFPAESLSWVADRIAAELAGDLEDPAFRAELSFRAWSMAPIRWRATRAAAVRDIARLTRTDVLEHHRRHFVARKHRPGRGRRL